MVRVWRETDIRKMNRLEELGMVGKFDVGVKKFNDEIGKKKKKILTT